MARSTPLKLMHEGAGAAVRLYGPPEAGVELVDALDYVEAEYAAIRKGCAILDQPHRGTLEVRGGERVGFLNRMVTQELKGLGEGAALESRRTFWLNRKGRIDADMRVIELGEGGMLIDVDVHNASAAAASLSQFVFSEDVEIVDRSEEWHRLGLHGPGASERLASRSEVEQGPSPRELAPGRACIVTVAGRRVVVDRQDSTGEVGLELAMAAGDAAAVYEELSVAPDPAARERGEGWKPDPSGRARRIGWQAYNIARIEAGWPLYHIDFGPDSLPHETGAAVLIDRVSFKKGCYLGQEVVARMQSLGHPKQVLVGLRIEAKSERELRLPETGAPVLVSAAEKPEVVGAVTSATISPMLGGAPIAFAMVNYKHVAPGTRLHVEVEGTTISAAVQEDLAFWRRSQA
jgi:folate-binding protein YgfZ